MILLTIMPMTPPPPHEGAPPAPSVSRERERVIAPPRSSVPAPGSGSAFGRGFVKRFRNSGAGCFLLLFIGVGSAIFLFGVAGTFGPYKEGLRENGDPRFFYAAMAFGTVFVLFALRMLQLALTEAENKSRKKGS